MKLYYPNDVNKKEYIKILTTAYHKKYPAFSKNQVNVMIQLVVINIDSVLFPPYRSLSREHMARNFKAFDTLLKLSWNEYNQLKLIPSESFKRLYCFGTGWDAENQIFLALERHDIDPDTFFKENQSKEAFLGFAAEMVKQCVEEIVPATERNIPYEFRPQRENIQSASFPNKKTSSGGVKKKVTWAGSQHANGINCENSNTLQTPQPESLSENQQQQEKIEGEPVVVCSSSHFKPSSQNTDEKLQPVNTSTNHTLIPNPG